MQQIYSCALGVHSTNTSYFNFKNLTIDKKKKFFFQFHFYYQQSTGWHSLYFLLVQNHQQVLGYQRDQAIQPAQWHHLHLYLHLDQEVQALQCLRPSPQGLWNQLDLGGQHLHLDLSLHAPLFDLGVLKRHHAQQVLVDPVGGVGGRLKKSE